MVVFDGPYKQKLPALATSRVGTDTLPERSTCFAPIFFQKNCGPVAAGCLTTIEMGRFDDGSYSTLQGPNKVFMSSGQMQVSGKVLDLSY